MPRPFDRLARNGLRFRMNAFRLRRLPVNGLKTKQCEQGIKKGSLRLKLKYNGCRRRAGSKCFRTLSVCRCQGDSACIHCIRQLTIIRPQPDASSLLHLRYEVLQAER